MNMNETAHSNNFQTQENLTVQQNLVTLVQLLEHDFRRIGYRYGGNPLPDSCVLYGRRDSVVFVGDVTADGTMDTVTWYVTDTLSTQALRNYWHIENKSVKLLIRIDRNPGHIPYIQTDTFAFGVTQFSISYYNGNMVPIYVDTATKKPYPHFAFPQSPFPVLMTVGLEVQPLVSYDSLFQSNFAFWTETRLVSKNLTAR